MLLPRTSARSLAGVMAWVLACTLLLAQTLGLMHGVVHVPQAHVHSSGHHHDHDHEHEHEHEHDHADAADADHGTGWLASLFSLHDGDSDCRLFDQASHGSTVPALVAVVLPMVLSSFVFDISRGEALARWAALFDARGPPLTR